MFQKYQKKMKTKHKIKKTFQTFFGMKRWQMGGMQSLSLTRTHGSFSSLIKQTNKQ